MKAVHFKFPVTVDGETDKDWLYAESDENGSYNETSDFMDSGLSSSFKPI